jgi:hypothetical protein
MRLYVVAALVIWFVIILSLGSLGWSLRSVRWAARLSTMLFPERLKRPEMAHVEGGPNVIALLAR